jgi:hypothetical protein
MTNNDWLFGVVSGESADRNTQVKSGSSRWNKAISLAGERLMNCRRFGFAKSELDCLELLDFLKTGCGGLPRSIACPECLFGRWALVGCREER